ncbi:CPBP family intramembrane glutamic endopeptidase [Kaistella jeonii]|uniref:CAAX prenyl protease 2/Lysostaphin resistance protein A-like domain-containing protein n=1 Tax=Kaistella jeonii TaxID=266749 RepID=A0A0C1FJ14_9FLAO|nr:type II CAAX endopeptidase family protein [Kaistella jeonii]KIA87914.1 hypothetical protein OA86_13425 [Kaistella jeonii]SFC33340.1 hypothetical protein SAMN05421876_11432 [Kaistella jeonii]VEI95534.1 CAAX amino terminal protease self- immunity [Kaistella jeonii]
MKENKKKIFGIILVVFIVAMSPLATKIFENRLSFTQVMILSRLWQWTGLLLLFYYCRKILKEKIIIWKSEKKGILFYFISIIGILAALFGMMVLIHLLHLPKENSPKLSQLMNAVKNNVPLIFLITITAGVVEELFFRAFLQTRISMLTKSNLFGIFTSTLIFALAHYAYGTWINMVGPFLIGLVFAVYYSKYRNIGVLIFVHFIWDFYALYTAA